MTNQCLDSTARPWSAAVHEWLCHLRAVGLAASRCQVPTLVLVGSEDTLTPPSESERMRELLPHATLDIIAQAGHLSNLEGPAAFDAALGAFLTTLA